MAGGPPVDHENFTFPVCIRAVCTAVSETEKIDDTTESCVTSVPEIEMSVSPEEGRVSILVVKVAGTTAALSVFVSQTCTIRGLISPDTKLKFEMQAFVDGLSIFSMYMILFTFLFFG